MPTLDFKGKQFVYAHHLSVPFREIKIDAKKSMPAAGAKPDLDDNLIIHGDNLHALKALLPQYAGKIKCIYIDPPYNTGNEGWCYNDNVRGPLIQEWLKESANPVDAQDLERHDKWLCVMWPRLQLLKELLSENGLIFVSIDENEHHALRALMDEIFAEENFIADFIWHSTGHSDNQYEVKVNHEYILCYAKNASECTLGNVVDPNTRAESNLWKGYAENSITKNGPKNPPSEIVLPVGFPCKAKNASLPQDKVSDDFFVRAKKLGYISRDLTKEFEVEYPIRLDEMIVKNGVLASPCSVYAGWANAKKLKAFIANGCKPIKEENGDLLHFYLSEKGVVYYKKERSSPKNILSVLTNFKTTEKMRSELEDIGIKFQYPKPNDLLEYLLKIANVRDGEIVLDSFAGSASTAHAVLLLNKEDNLNRRFILVECEDYAEGITAQRVRSAIQGTPKAKESSPFKVGTGGSFTFCALGQEINIDSLLKGDDLPEYEALARYVFYTATGKTLEKVSKPTADWFIGETGMYNVHLIYKPDVEFLRGNQSALNADLVAKIQERGKGKKSLVFATAKFMGQKELSAANIDFCQLPYAIHRILGE